MIYWGAIYFVVIYIMKELTTFGVAGLLKCKGFTVDIRKLYNIIRVKEINQARVWKKIVVNIARVVVVGLVYYNSEGMYKKIASVYALVSIIPMYKTEMYVIIESIVEWTCGILNGSSIMMKVSKWSVWTWFLIMIAYIVVYGTSIVVISIWYCLYTINKKNDKKIMNNAIIRLVSMRECKYSKRKVKHIYVDCDCKITDVIGCINGEYYFLFSTFDNDRIRTITHIELLIAYVNGGCNYISEV